MYYKDTVYFQLSALVHIYRQLPNVSAIYCGHLQGVHWQTYVVFFNLYFAIYQRRCYILTLYLTLVWNVILEDGHKRWPKHVGLTSTSELLQ